MFVIATIVWGLRKSSLVIVLALLLLMATKPGFIHAVYSKLNKCTHLVKLMHKHFSSDV